MENGSPTATPRLPLVLTSRRTRSAEQHPQRGRWVMVRPCAPRPAVRHAGEGLARLLHGGRAAERAAPGGAGEAAGARQRAGASLAARRLPPARARGLPREPRGRGRFPQGPEALAEAAEGGEPRRALPGPSGEGAQAPHASPPCARWRPPRRATTRRGRRRRRRRPARATPRPTAPCPRSSCGSCRSAWSAAPGRRRRYGWHGCPRLRPSPPAPPSPGP